MSSGEPVALDSPGLDGDALRRVLVVLSVTQIVSWGTLFYTLPVLASEISEETGWSLTWVVAAFTGSQLVAAAGSVVVGRRINHRGPRQVMSLGAVVGALGLVAVAAAPTLPVFALAWAVTGSAMSAVLYPPAFAALTEWAGTQRVRALTVLTLVAGFASTVFAPLAGFLVDPIGWRNTYLVMAGLLLATAPVLALALHHPWRATGHDATPEESAQLGRTVRRSHAFVRLVAAMSMAGFAQWAAVFLLVPLLIQRGMSTETAALALAGGGVGQVCGRLAYARIAALSGVTARTRAVFAGVAVSTLALAAIPGPDALLFLLAFAAGIARGIYTLIQATSVTDRWGTGAYATLNGIMSATLLVAGATAPWIGTALARATDSYAVVFACLAVVATTAIAVTPGE